MAVPIETLLDYDKTFPYGVRSANSEVMAAIRSY